MKNARARGFALAAGAFALLVGGSAHAWDPFLSKNRNVEDGNRALGERDSRGALAAYDRAARELPSAPGVHLDRGLAQLESGDAAGARESFLRATEPPATAPVRAAAYYNLGLGFYREADAAAEGDNHQEAQRLFREAADGFRRSLRARPGNRDAAWNLELALRRIREEQEEQQQQEQQQQQQQQQDQQQQDQQQQDQQQQDQQQQDQQQQDQQQQDQQQQDQQQQDQQQQDQQQQDQQQQQQQDEQDQQSQAERESPSQNPDSQQQSQSSGRPRDQESAPSGGQELPEHVERVLDALQNSEDNLERHRARVRARRESRRVTMDW